MNCATKLHWSSKLVTSKQRKFSRICSFLEYLLQRRQRTTFLYCHLIAITRALRMYANCNVFFFHQHRMFCMPLSPMPYHDRCDKRELETFLSCVEGNQLSLTKISTVRAVPIHQKNARRQSRKGSICFPVSSNCPITNRLVQPGTPLASAGHGWEAVGVFEAYNTTFSTKISHQLTLILHSLEKLYTVLTRPRRPKRSEDIHCANLTNI